jgi:hypothetical protein
MKSSVIRSLLAFALVLSIHASASAQGTWKTFTQTKGNFSVQLPGTPKAQDQSVDTKVGKITAHMYLLEGNPTYVIAFNDYPAASMAGADPSKVLEGSATGAVSNVKATLTSKKKITIKGYPGREITFNNPKFLGKSRIYLVKNRLYQLTAIIPKPGTYNADVNRFLTSFKLLK